LTTYFILVIIGLTVGMITGTFGLGGGLLLVPALIFFIGMDQHTAQGTSVAIMLLPVGMFAFLTYYKAGYVNIKYAFAIAVAFIVGSYFGSIISLNISEHLLRKLFGAVIFLMAIKFIVMK
jgi:uncharacterized protein